MLYILIKYILIGGNWVFITVGISEDDSEIYISGYYPNYRTGPKYYTDDIYKKGSDITPYGFDFSNIRFYVANRGSGDTNESMCGYI